MGNSDMDIDLNLFDDEDMQGIDVEQVVESKAADISNEDLIQFVMYAPIATPFSAVTAPFLFGATWNYLRFDDDNEEDEYYKQYAEAVVEGSSQFVSAYKFDNTYLVDVHPNLFIKYWQKADTTMLEDEDIKDLQDSILDSLSDLSLFLSNRAKKAGYEGKLCIYSVADVNTVIIDGLTYPTYRINLDMALNIFEKWHFNIKIGDEYKTPVEVRENKDMFFANTKLIGDEGLVVVIKRQ